MYDKKNEREKGLLARGELMIYENIHEFWIGSTI